MISDVLAEAKEKMRKAVEVAKGVKGVKSVKNDMILKGTQ